MLDAICRELNNYFDTARYHGKFEIKDGRLTSNLPLKENQYFRIVGSTFNDGVYQNGSYSSLYDETFDGCIWSMAVPRTVIDLSDDVEQWKKKYGEQMQSPYQSESFGGYSYTKKTSSVGNGDTWQNVFRNTLNKYRKLKYGSNNNDIYMNEV